MSSHVHSSHRPVKARRSYCLQTRSPVCSRPPPKLLHPHPHRAKASTIPHFHIHLRQLAVHSSPHHFLAPWTSGINHCSVQHWLWHCLHPSNTTSQSWALVSNQDSPASDLIWGPYLSMGHRPSTTGTEHCSYSVFPYSKKYRVPSSIFSHSHTLTPAPPLDCCSSSVTLTTHAADHGN